MIWAYLAQEEFHSFTAKYLGMDGKGKGSSEKRMIKSEP